MPATVVYDACVLHPAPLRDLLIRVARAGLVRARWTNAILDECFGSIVRRRPELEGPLRRTRELMNAAVADCLVTGHEALIAELSLPDADDRHVLAAAVHARAATIVTQNLKDFPAAALAPYDIEATAPDEFLIELIAAAPEAMASIVRRQAHDLRAPPRTPVELVAIFRKLGLDATSARLESLVEQGGSG